MDNLTLRRFMKKQTTFEERLFAKVHEQINGRRTGFLLGAGASFLDGKGYPLASDLWPAIKQQMSNDDKCLIEAEMLRGISTLENALDAIDKGREIDIDLRHRVTCAIAKTFFNHKPPLECHKQFVKHLEKRNEIRIPVFTLNYDPLIEIAADQEQRFLIDGFCGTIEGYFNPTCFFDYRGYYDSRRSKTVLSPFRGIINLYKLHGSLGWFVDQESNLKRIRPDIPCPSGWRHLMIPPQNRKAADTGSTPYADLWSEFRAHLANDFSKLLNRLVCVGYGLGDGHVNAVINSALDRNNFTLVVLAKALKDDAFGRWNTRHNTIIVTETRSSLYGEEGPGIPDAWSFEWLSKEV